MGLTETQKVRHHQNLNEGKSALEELVAWDYQVVQLSEYHFRINSRIDVWPSSKKWYIPRTGEKGTYTNLVQFIKSKIKN